MEFKKEVGHGIALGVLAAGCTQAVHRVCARMVQGGWPCVMHVSSGGGGVGIFCASWFGYCLRAVHLSLVSFFALSLHICHKWDGAA